MAGAFKVHERHYLDRFMELTRPVGQIYVGSDELENELNKAVDVHPVFKKLNYAFFEIDRCLKRIVLLCDLAGLAPPRSKKIVPSEYYKSLFAYHLQEIFILREMLKAYLNLVKKNQETLPKKDLTDFIKDVLGRFSAVEGVRNIHVHQREWVTGDDQLLSMLIDLKEIAPQDDLIELYSKKLSFLKRKNKFQMDANYNNIVI